MIEQIGVAFLCMCIVLGAGFLLTLSSLTEWYQRLRKPSWQPPDWLFGPAWTTIGLLSVAAGVIAWRTGNAAQRSTEITLFAVNGVLNAGWSGLFFKMRRPDFALVEVGPLWLSVLALVIAFSGYAPISSWLMVPYLVWVGFASVLNWKVFALNRPFGPAPGAT